MVVVENHEERQHLVRGRSRSPHQQRVGAAPYSRLGRPLRARFASRLGGRPDPYAAGRHQGLRRDDAAMRRTPRTLLGRQKAPYGRSGRSLGASRQYDAVRSADAGSRRTVLIGSDLSETRTVRRAVDVSTLLPVHSAETRSEPTLSDADPERPDGQSMATRISNRVVQLMSAYTGRGPTRAWTSIDSELISVVLRDTLTKGELSLLADGRAQLVLDMRKAYQNTMARDLVAAVEEITGRKVIAFLSDNHIDPDIAIESFVLESAPTRAGSNPTTG